MTGHSDPISTVRWTDAYLLDVSVQYDRVEVRVREPGGSVAVVSALGHIGISLVGFWDETVIETADVVTEHPFGEQCQLSIGERLGPNAAASGSPDRNTGAVMTLVVTLGDGARLFVAATRFELARE